MKRTIHNVMYVTHIMAVVWQFTNIAQKPCRRYGENYAQRSICDLYSGHSG